MPTIAQRIKEALELRNMKQAELSEITKIGKSSISTYISGAYEPKQKNLYKIAKALGVNEAWLMGYDVSMERVNATEMEEHKNKMINISKSWDIQYLENKLLEPFSQLTDSNKKKAINYTENLLQIQQLEKEQEHLIPVAAHERTDIEVTDEMRAHDDAFFDDF